MHLVLFALFLTIGQLAAAVDIKFVVSSNPLYSEEVKLIQERLLELDYSEVGKADGYYGNKTDKAFTRFKYRNLLPRNAIYDEQTKETLFSKDARRGTPPMGPRPTLLALNKDLFGGWSAKDGWIPPAELIQYFDDSSTYEGNWYSSQFSGKASFKIDSDQTGGPAFHSMELVETTFFPISNPDGPIWITTGTINVFSQPQIESPTFQEITFARNSTKTWLSAKGIVVEPTKFSVIAYDSPKGNRNLLVTAERLTGNSEWVKKAQTFNVCLLFSRINGKSDVYSVFSDIYLMTVDNFHGTEQRLLSINDLNGDGEPEFLIDWYYYEGAGTSIYSKIGDSYEPVLSIGSGA